MGEPTGQDEAPASTLNLEKLRKMQEMSASSKIGGKGVPRRKKKLIHKTPQSDEKKLQATLKKIGLSQIQGIDEVNIFRSTDSTGAQKHTVMHLKNPRVCAAASSNTFSITGAAEEKQLQDMFPSILSQIGVENLVHFKDLLGGKMAAASDDKKADDDDDAPALEANDFEKAAEEAMQTSK